MTPEEKFGQLFINLKAVPGADPERAAKELAVSHQGGLRWQGGNKQDVFRQNRIYQQASKIPLLIAANCDEGGRGCLPEGTFVATAAEAGASGDTEAAYHTGLVAGYEASAIGCNMLFNPITDIYKNWRNTIVNTRSFGDDASLVLENARAYIRGVKEANPYMACTMKHFPGDGVDELDQHLVMGVNDLPAKEWEESFGMVYRALIEDGIEAVMVGHITQPNLIRKLHPEIRDEEILPASLSDILLQEVLRERLGFNGLIISDASHMIGMSAVMSRARAVPQAIAAGCDMFLFSNDVEEDISFMKAGYEEGIITPERLSDALHRILGMKEHMHLYDDKVRFPKEEALETQIGCEIYHDYSAQAADKGITLVKDTQHLLPVDPETKKSVFLVYVPTPPNGKGYQGDPVKQILIEELERAGFIVDAVPSYHDLELENGVSPMNFIRMLEHGRRDEFIRNHDLALVVFNIKGYAQENEVRVKWSCNHSKEMPWYSSEIPTIGLSLNYTNHLIDVPQLKTYINAYSAERTHIRAAIDKICGRSPFKGRYNDSVFCGRWETRL